MPRPRKRKRVCQEPKRKLFGSLDGATPHKDPIVMLVEEYETIRLIDYEGFTQAECAVQMAVARTTVQSLYEKARKKLAATLIDNRPIKIEGGFYRFCTEEDICNQKGCDFIKEREHTNNHS
jgi:predicted DNA-binding protein (UPF0251 family)